MFGEIYADKGLIVVEPLAAFLHSIPLLCLFLAILCGTIIGRVHVKGVGFGSVVGTLIAGMAIGILAKPELPDLLRWAFFYLFLFSIGYSVGPQFFGSLKKEALPQIALALIVAVTGLATVIGVSALFGFDEGLSVGVLSGGMSPVRGLVGTANYGKNDFYTTPQWKHTTQTEFDISQVTQIPRVDLIMAYLDMPGDPIDAAVAAGAKGIVIAGVGNGNMTKAAVTAAANAVKKGVVVVRSSRVVTGNVGRNVELNDDQLGFIASDELNPQKSRILLSLALLKPHTPAQVQEMFRVY